MYPVVEHTRPNRAARNHSRSRAPHHRTQENARQERAVFILRQFRSYSDIIVLTRACNLICLGLSAGRGKGLSAGRGIYLINEI